MNLFFFTFHVGTSDGHSTTRTSSSDNSNPDTNYKSPRANDAPKSPHDQNGEPEEGPTPQELNLYDSLAAELRAKLGGKGKDEPILLPPKDYDTVHRAKGRLIDIEERKATDERVVGKVGAHGMSGVAAQAQPAPTKYTKPPPLAPGKKASNDSARGESEGGSYGDPGLSDVGKAIQNMAFPSIRVEGDGEGRDSREDSYGRRSRPVSQHSSGRQSNGIPDDPYADDYRGNLSPRSAGRGDHSPRISPRSPRGASPLPRSRELSPVRYNPLMDRGPPGGGRPMSPPPELRDSYFPKNMGLPNYLGGGGLDSGGSYGDPGWNRYQQDYTGSYGDISPRYGGGGSQVGGRNLNAPGPKYSATNLGLTDRVPMRRSPAGPRPDEGYRSMDRHENRRPHSGQFYDNPYSSMDRNLDYRDRDLDPRHPGYGYPNEMDLTASMPAMGFQHYRGREDNPRNSRGYDDELPPPDYSMRGIPASAGSGFDYLP